MLVAAPDAPADLVELRQAEHVGALDDQRVGGRDVDAALDDRCRHEDVRVAGADHAVIAQAVAVRHRALQHVGDGFDAAVRVPRKAGQIVVGPVRAEVVEEQERVDVVQRRGGDAALEAHAGALDDRLRGDDALHGAELLAHCCAPPEGVVVA